MSPALRTVLMWLLMLAIPVQGIAASAMLNCGPGHAPAQQQAAPGHEHADGHAQHGHQGGHGASSGADQASDGTNAPAPQGGAKCSACASCCHAAAIVGTPPSIAVVTPDTAPDVAVRSGFEAVVPDALERPPRRTLG